MNKHTQNKEIENLEGAKEGFEFQDEYLDKFRNEVKQNFMFSGMGRNQTEATNSIMNSEYTKESIAEWFKEPSSYKKEIMDASSYLYATNGLYKSKINYHTNLPTLDYVLVPDFNMPLIGGNIDKEIEGNIESIFKSKNKIKEYLDGILEKSNIRKILKSTFTYGVYYGYEEQDSNKKMFFQDLDKDYCRVDSYADGMPAITFDFSYFDGKEELLEVYPSEFKKLHNEYTSGKDNGDNWRQLDPSTSICILIDENGYSLPAFSDMFPDILDSNDFYSYLKRNTDFETLRFLIQKGLINEKTGDPLTSPKILRAFNEILQKVFGDDVKVGSTIFDIEPIDFSKSGGSNGDDLGIEHVKERTFTNAGLSPAITGESDNATSVKYNDSNATNLVMSVLEKIERWINNNIYKKASPKKYAWKIKFLPTTLNNSGEIHKSFKEMFNYGGSLRYALSSLGVNQDDYINLMQIEYLEGLIEMLTPPSNTHTTPSDDSENGRPLSDEDELGDDGEKTRDTDGNER